MEWIITEVTLVVLAGWLGYEFFSKASLDCYPLLLTMVQGFFSMAIAAAVLCLGKGIPYTTSSLAFGFFALIILVSHGVKSFFMAYRMIRAFKKTKKTIQTE